MINITSCNASDIDVLLNIAIQTYKQTYTYLWLDDGAAYLDRFYERDDLEKDLSTPGVYYFLVYDNDIVAGYFKLKESAFAPYLLYKCVEIEKLYLLQQLTGRGTGKVIMDFILDFAKNAQRSILWLKVMESSPAKLFYEIYGFKQTGRAHLDYPYMIDEYRWLLTYMLALAA